jgi:hypothetical protein
LWVIFALLDPDPDSEYGSGSTDLIEYGSNTDPDPGSGSTTLYRVVPEVIVMLGDGRQEKSTRLFFLEIMPYRSAVPRKAPEPYLVAAHGVKEVAPAAALAPELPLLRERFKTRPTLTMGGLAQKEGPIELVIARDYWRYGLGCLTAAVSPLTTYIL